MRTDLLVDTGEHVHSPSRGDARVLTVKAGDVEARAAAFWYDDGAEFDEIVDHIRLDWSAMDSWFEEDEEVYVHPRDPYTRLDTLRSSRHVRVELDGVTIADSTRPTILFETGLPTRYYLPKTDVRMDLLTPTEHHTQCPYKGEASYYAVTTPAGRHDNIVWWYPAPIPESTKIAGLLCFYNERVDLFVDGMREEPGYRGAGPLEP